MKQTLSRGNSPFPGAPHALYRYGVAIGSVAVAAAVRLAFLQILGTRATYLTFYPAVMVAALYGGWRAGLLATVLSACLADYFWIQPAGSLLIKDDADWVSLGIFVLNCAMISWITGAMQRAQRQAQDAEAKIVTQHPRQLAHAPHAGDDRFSVKRYKAVFPVSAVFAVALASFIGVSWLGYHNATSMAESDKWETQTHVVILKLGRLLSTLKDAETGQRGFLITGDEQYLAPYLTAVSQVDQEMAGLNDLTRDNPAQYKRLQELEPVISGKLLELKQTIEARRTDGFEAAQQIVAGNIGRARMVDIRTRLGEMEAEEESLLHERTKAKTADTRAMLYTGVVGGLLSFTLFLLTYGLLRNEITQHAEAEEDLKTHRDNLDNLVKIRTAELEAEVTERKQAAEAFQESQAKLEAALSSMTDAVFISDKSGHFGTFNDAFVSFHRFTSKEECSRRVSDFSDILEVFAPDGELVPQEMWAIPRALRGERVTNAEYILRRKDTGDTWVSSYSFSPIRNKDGGIVGSVVVGRDITEHKQQVEAARGYRAKLEVALDSMTDAVFISDANGQFVDFNEAFATFCRFGNKAESLKTFSEYPQIIEMFMANGELAPVEMWPVQRALRGEIARDVQYRLHRKDTDETWIGSHNLAPIRDKSGAIVGSVVVARDITEQVRAEKALRERTAEVQSKSAELERFFYAISHDLKSPVVTIKTFLSYLQQDLAAADSEKTEKDMRYLQMAAEKMGRLLDELLEMSRIGRVVNPPENVMFRALVDEALGAVAGLIAERGVAVQVNECERMLRGDKPRLAQLWQNLVENAAKFMGDQKEPRIEIGMEMREAEVVFFVRDNGKGIDPRFHTRVFDLFQKLDAKAAGTGIGLALVKRITEAYGGQVWVESAGVGHGTTFLFTLPDAINQTPNQQNPHGR